MFGETKRSSKSLLSALDMDGTLDFDCYSLGTIQILRKHCTVVDLSTRRAFLNIGQSL